MEDEEPAEEEDIRAKLARTLGGGGAPPGKSTP